MRSVDIANIFIDRYGKDAVLSNLSLNQLVYYAKVESLRAGEGPLFSDGVEAWEWGPVEPSVCHAFKRYGSGRITVPSGPVPSDAHAVRVVDVTFSKCGQMTAFDLAGLSHREGSAWKSAFTPGASVPITDADILSSSDGVEEPTLSGTLASGIKEVNEAWPNTFMLLRNA